MKKTQRKPTKKIPDTARKMVNLLWKTDSTDSVTEIQRRIMLCDYLLPAIQAHALCGSESALRFAFTWSSLFADALQCRMQYAPTKHLKELFENEYIFAWLMVNGKPAPGCPAKNNLFRKGKHRFDSRATEAVADALQDMHRERLHGLRDAESVKFWSEVNPESKTIYALNEKINALPPLSQKTRNAWWILLRRIIKSNPQLSKAELDRFKKWTAYETDKEAVEQFLKKCKQRFFALCPDA